MKPNSLQVVHVYVLFSVPLFLGGKNLEPHLRYVTC